MLPEESKASDGTGAGHWLRIASWSARTGVLRLILMHTLTLDLLGRLTRTLPPESACGVRKPAKCIRLEFTFTVLMTVRITVSLAVTSKAACNEPFTDSIRLQSVQISKFLNSK